MINILDYNFFFTDDIIIISDSEMSHLSETPSQELYIARISESDIAGIAQTLHTNIFFYPFLKICLKFKIKNVYFPPDVTYGCNIEEYTVKRKGIDISFSEEEDFSIKDEKPEKPSDMLLLGALSSDSLPDLTMPQSYRKGK